MLHMYLVLLIFIDFSMFYQSCFFTDKSDCSSKPRACANCSCGRKELEVQYGAEEAKQRLEKAQTRSSCGSVSDRSSYIHERL